MVLLVADIKYTGEGASGRFSGPFAVVEMTDGWYGVNAIFDSVLTRSLRQGTKNNNYLADILGKIFVGQKLHVYGAKVDGNEQGCTPLELNESTMVMLKLSGNGMYSTRFHILILLATRRAKWWETLGVQSCPSFSISLSSVKSDGGVIPCLDLCIERVFPVIFSEKVNFSFMPLNYAYFLQVILKQPQKGEDDEPELVIRIRRSRHGEEKVSQNFIQRKQDVMAAKYAEIQDRLEREEVSPYLPMNLLTTN